MTAARTRGRPPRPKGSELRYLRTQNGLGIAAMRSVNEKLGYERKFEWVHLAGPLLAD